MKISCDFLKNIMITSNVREITFTTNDTKGLLCLIYMFIQIDKKNNKTPNKKDGQRKGRTNTSFPKRGNMES